MKLKSILASIALLLAGAAPVTAAPSPLSILQIRDSLHNVPIIYPESFETDVHKMQQNWYLKNYADIDRSADTRTSTELPPDEVIIERLGSLPTIIELPYNSVVRNYISMYVNRKKQLVENMLGMSLYYMPIFEQALDRNGMPLELKYLPVIESALNPDAVSRAGATGLWQFMLPTATGEGLEISSLVDQRRDPYASSEAAACYLKKLHEIFGNWSLAIAAYNCGPGNVNKAIRRAGGGTKDFWQIYPYLPAETRGYVPAFIAANYAMNFYDKHNISPALARKPIVTDTIHVKRRVHFEQIRDVLGIPMEELQTFNPQYRTGLIPGDIRPYTLVLPSLQVYAYLANEDSIVNHNAERYARRDVVEPAPDGSGVDSKGAYVEELVVKYHTVRRGQTLAKIANMYGVTAASIRKTNKIGRKVRRGQKLRINTYKRRYIDQAPEQAPEQAPAVESTAQDVQQTTVPVEENTAAVPAANTDTVATSEAPKYVEHTASDETSEEQPQAESKVESAESSRVSQAISGSNSRRQAAASKAKAEKSKKKDSAKASTTKHKVRRGENLGRIAARYGTTVKAIRNANGMKNDNIREGQTLVIPSGKKSSRRR